MIYMTDEDMAELKRWRIAQEMHAKIGELGTMTPQVNHGQMLAENRHERRKRAKLERVKR